MVATTEELFSAALSLPAPERDQFLRRACGSDSTRQAQIDALLEALPPSAKFIRESQEAFIPESSEATIDGYRLIHELGEGGGGVVYLAEQLTPIKREVALKIIKLGMDTRAVINRFEAERQALAMMDHPNIAKVLAAGATQTGRPYFVMELVRGIRITSYCDQCRLTVAERLDLFLQVCNAIEHAHQQHIVHRDIKPANVLVTLHGGEALVKVIDFGVAKATQGRLTDQTLFTMVDQFIGTPAYVSPEQTAMDVANVDARSDIYSLGVLLYELITGCTPLDPNELTGATLDEVRRRIREEAPVKPSKRLRALDSEQLKATAEARRVPPQRLGDETRGDLECIVMRCLEKESARRYRRASDLAADLTRLLRSEPVLARPPSAMYLFRKFAARHRVFLIAVFSVITSLLVATAVSAWQAVRATKAERIALQEGARAEEVSQLLLSVFTAADPFVSTRGTPSVLELLEQAARGFDRRNLNGPEIRWRLLFAIGESYRHRVDPVKAIVHLRAAVQLLRTVPASHDDLPSLLIELAGALAENEQFAEADRYLAEARKMLAESKRDVSATSAWLASELSNLERLRGRPVLALQHSRRALELMGTAKGVDHPHVGGVLLTMALALVWVDDLEGAERATREAVRIFTVLPEHHPHRVAADSRMAEILFFKGSLDEAAALFGRVLDAQRRLFGSSVVTADTLASLAQVRLAQGHLVQAEHFAEEALQMHRGVNPTSHLQIGYLQTLLASTRLRANKLDGAVALLREAITLLSRHALTDHQYIASAEHYLGEALLRQGQLSDAELALRTAMARWKRNGAPAWRAARSEIALAEVLHKLGRAEEAERHFINSYPLLATDAGADQDTKRMARDRLVRFYTDVGRRAELTALLGGKANSLGSATRKIVALHD